MRSSSNINTINWCEITFGWTMIEWNPQRLRPHQTMHEIETVMSPSKTGKVFLYTIYIIYIYTCHTHIYIYISWDYLRHILRIWMKTSPKNTFLGRGFRIARGNHLTPASPRGNPAWSRGTALELCTAVPLPSTDLPWWQKPFGPETSFDMGMGQN